MTKTITLTDLVIKQLNINYERQHVRVTFSMVDASGVVWEDHVAFFWVTMPQVTNDYDFQLPSTYLPTLLGLRDDADAALTARFLV